MISVVRYVINIVINYVITSWLLIGRLPRKFGALVVSKFNSFYLAQKSRRRVADLLDLSRHVEIDLSWRRPGPRLFWSLTCLRHVGDLLKTCRRPGFKQVLRKIDVMEFGHNQPINWLGRSILMYRTYSLPADILLCKRPIKHCATVNLF